VRLLGVNLIDDFIRRHPDSKSGLRRWQKLIRETDFVSIVDLRRTFPTADAVGGKTVFNVGSNKVRTITEIQYGIAMVIVTHVLTHAEYDRGRWKDG
jgi:mRNA interferase HigB